MHPEPRLRRTRTLLALGLVAATAGAGFVLQARPTGASTHPADGGPGAATPVVQGAGGVRLGAALDRSRVYVGPSRPGADADARMELVLAADAIPGAPVRRPTDLVVVLDRSGSMAGEKIAHARAAIAALLEQLGPEDRFALVAYANATRVVVPLEAPGAGARARWLERVGALGVGGGTDLSAGLDRALGLVEAARGGARVPRVILISDGLANQGDVSRDGLRRRAARAAQGAYALSTVGVGRDFDEELLAALADAGTGNYHYLASARGLAEIFADEFATARETVARALELRFAPARGVVLTDVAGYPLERDAEGAVVVRPGSLFSGQERRIWVSLRVEDPEPGPQALGRIALRYRTAAGAQEIALDALLTLTRVADAEAYFAGLDRARWAAGVAVDAYNRLKRQVAADLKAGRPQMAEERIDAFGRTHRSANEAVGSSDVARTLAESEALRAELQAAAAAPAPLRADRAKALQAEAVMDARPGSRK